MSRDEGVAKGTIGDERNETSNMDKTHKKLVYGMRRKGAKQQKDGVMMTALQNFFTISKNCEK